MRITALFIITLIPILALGQWIDTTFTIETDYNISYGSAIDFAGAHQILEMDISYPTNDQAPSCGRPLLVMIHGGAWLAGDKSESTSKRIREDFAKRGYTTASINYRLGQFHTDQYVNCNIPGWNCLNMTDTAEWYRAYYRGIQDANGAIRYLINNSNVYNIDPNNTFVVGESAGGYLAMGVGFMDDVSEAASTLIDSINTVLPPNPLYEGPCIQDAPYHLADSIATMHLTRPNLGSYEGTLNFPSNKPYQIKAVGNFFGGVFDNIFQTSNGVNPPALYMFHQLNDLIVPYTYQKIFNGYVNCSLGFPFNCGYLTDRPYSYGSNGIKTLIDTMISNGLLAPEYLFENTLNNSNCIQQATTPSLQCHQIDNYWVRTTNMATFFAPKIDSCSTVGVSDGHVDINSVNIYPNPTNSNITIDLGEVYDLIDITIISTLGQVAKVYNFKHAELITLDLSDFESSLYAIKITLNNRSILTKKVIKK